MTLKVSLDIAKQVSICTPAFEEIVKYYTDNGIETATVEEMVTHWKSIGRRDWALWLYAHVPEFERLVQQESTQQEKESFAADEQYLNTIQTIGYSVNNIKYQTLEEAEVARTKRLAELKEEIEPLCVCSLEIIFDNGDSSWKVIDLDDFVVPDEKPHTIKVFNPISGQYTTFDNINDAIVSRNDIIIQTSDYMNGTSRILEVKQHPDFPNEEPTL